ncbi:MAG: hypothetical protein ACE5F7_02520 [Nitrospiria bacterium]
MPELEITSKEKSRATKPVPYDLMVLGIVMVISGIMDTYLIIANPDYRLPVFGMKLEGPLGWYLNLVFPVIHFIIGYGVILARRWSYHLFMGFTIYGIISALVNLIRLPPPHNIRTIFLVVSFLVLVYLYMRRGHFNR